MMDPMEAIQRDPPNVWLTSFYGFDPGNWGYLGFSTDAQRKSFIQRSEPGVLVVIYGTGNADPDQLGRVIGVLQCSHRVNKAKEYMSPSAWADKEQSADMRGKWNLGVKAVRAWKLAPDTRPPVAEFAHETYTPSRGQVIGSQGMPLSAAEAQKLLALNLQEVPVFGELPVTEAAYGSGAMVLSPSKPGPVSQSPHVVREAEGPTSLYVLVLDGDANAFMGFDVGVQRIVKVGVSKSPPGRCDDHNRALPKCAFEWRLTRSNAIASLDHFPNSRSAIVGETEMKRTLVERGQSLGGEFFLANDDAINAAWESGIRKAEDWARM